MWRGFPKANETLIDGEIQSQAQAQTKEIK